VHSAVVALQIALIGLSIVLVLEVAARSWIAYRSVYRVFAPHMRVEMELLPTVFPTLESHVRLYINSRGERASEQPPTSTSQGYRVLVVGGSMAEGSALDQPQTWPAQLEQMLRSEAALGRLRRPFVHVANVARSSLDAPSAELLLRKMASMYKDWDCLILMVGASDVLNWLKRGAPALPQYDTMSYDDLFAWHPKRRFSCRPRQSAIAELCRRFRQVFVRPIYHKGPVGHSVNQARRARIDARDKLHELPDCSGMLANFEAAMRSILTNNLCQFRRLVVVRPVWFDRTLVTPDEDAQFWHGAIGQLRGTCSPQYLSHSALCHVFNLLDDRTVGICSELNVPTVCPRCFIEPTLDTYYDQFHFTARGAQIAARQVARVILDLLD
jgi:lysophospholipase L1-like esterase